MAVIIKKSSKEAEYPKDHKPAMRVPVGGSSCSTCEYLGDDEQTCKNKYYIAWNNSDKLPFPASQFCSDWYEPEKPLTDDADDD